MKYSFHPYAKTELNKAIDYYEAFQPGLGLEFAKECYLTIYRIIKYPKAWAPLSKNTRRCLTNRFPYGIIYQILEKEVFIIAVMHLNKKPNYWKERTK